MRKTQFIILFLLISGTHYAQTHKILKDLAPGPYSGVPSTVEFINWHGHEYFIGTGQGATQRIWTTDGTSENTVPVLDDNTYSVGSIAALEDFLVFSAHSGYDASIFITNGTQASTTQIKVIPRASILFMTSFNSEKAIFLTINEFRDTTQLWITDGSPTGTFPLSQLTFNPEHFNFSFYKDKIIFSETKTTDHFSPVISDGTVAGTKLLIDYVNDIIPEDIPTLTTAFGTNGFLFLKSQQDEIGYVFDGTSIADIPFSGEIHSAFRLEERNIVFAGHDLIIYDSLTSTYTTILSDLYLTTHPIIFESKIYFHGAFSFVWETDGTVDGTKKVSLMDAGGSLYYHYLYGYQHQLYYSVETADKYSIRRIDLATEKDTFFTDVRGTSGLVFDMFMKGISDHILYLKLTNEQGKELWVSESLISFINPLKQLAVNVRVYPNPVFNDLFIEIHDPIKLEGVTIDVFNEEGRLLNQVHVGEKLVSINVRKYPPGKYSMYIKNDLRKQYLGSFIKL